MTTPPTHDDLRPIRLPDGRVKDPPAVRKLAARGDPPMEDWPGRVIGAVDIARAAGDPRDWFRYSHRYDAAAEAWAEFADAQHRRRNLLSDDWEFNQVLIVGDYGSGKTSAAMLVARDMFGRGHPVFANASSLFGWRLGQNELYTSMGRIPKGSVLIVDESSAALASRLGGSTAISSWTEMSLNLRKQATYCILMSAQDWQIASAVRKDCKEVWMPVASDQIEFERDPYSRAPVNEVNPNVAPSADPANFILVWHVWRDYPYRKANLIEGKVDEQDGFGRPDDTVVTMGEEVRRALLLNDTFELAQAGSASTADGEQIKEDLREWRGEHFDDGANGRSSRKPPQELVRLFMFIEQLEFAMPFPEYVKPAVLAAEMGVSVPRAGTIVQERFPGVENVQRKGYSSEYLLAYWRKHYEPHL